MPLIIKVSVSRKLSQDYNSHGYCLDIQSEFDPRTFDDTDALANSTNHLFALANDLLDQQVQQASEGNHQNGIGQLKPAYNGAHGQGRNGGTSTAANKRLPTNGAYSRPGNGHGQSNGPANGGNRNGGSSQGGNGRAERSITSAQINAVSKMAQKLDTNGDVVALEDYNCKLAELTIRQGSDLIDRLKKVLEAQGGQAVGR